MPLNMAKAVSFVFIWMYINRGGNPINVMFGNEIA